MPKRVYRGTWKASGLRLLHNFEYNLLDWVNGEGAGAPFLEQDRDRDFQAFLILPVHQPSRQAFCNFLGKRPHGLVCQLPRLEDEIGSQIHELALTRRKC